MENPRKNRGFFVFSGEHGDIGDRRAMGLPCNASEGNAVTIATTTPADATAPALIDVGTVAALLTCSKRHVIRLADAGRMPLPLRLGALVRWRRQEILDWIGHGCPDKRQRAS